MSLTELTDAAIAEASAFADLLDTVPTSRRTASTPCARWSVDDLAAHVATGAFRDAEAFHRARFGTVSGPGELVLAGESGQTSDRIRLAVDHLRAAIRNGPEKWPLIPLPFGRYPAAPALQMLTIEFGVHRNDLEVAVADPDAGFSAATLAALFGFGTNYLLLQAEPLDERPLSFRLVAPSTTMSITWDGVHWKAGAEAGEICCCITGSDDMIARIMLRRAAITDERLVLDDPAGVADRFAAAIRTL